MRTSEARKRAETGEAKAVVAECRRCGKVNAFDSLLDSDGRQSPWVQHWFDRGDAVRVAREGEVVRIACSCSATDRARADAAARQRERRREVLRDALGAVWSGADFTDADCVLDHLGDLGYRVVEQ